MGRRKSSGAGSVILVLVVLVGLLAKFVEENWQAIVAVISVCFVVWLALRASKAASAKPSDPDRALFNSGSGNQQPVRTSLTTANGGRASATSHDGEKFWNGPNQVRIVDGKQVGPLVYVGSGLASVGGGSIEPALIDPKLKVASGTYDLAVRRVDYWPSYSTASPEARAAYLTWLSSGRSAPAADPERVNDFGTTGFMSLESKRWC
jgi:hypothetical protein